jgi:hypothetical protein
VTGCTAKTSRPPKPWRVNSESQRTWTKTSSKSPYNSRIRNCNRSTINTFRLSFRRWATVTPIRRNTRRNLSIWSLALCRIFRKRLIRSLCPSNLITRSVFRKTIRHNCRIIRHTIAGFRLVWDCVVKRRMGSSVRNCSKRKIWILFWVVMRRGNMLISIIWIWIYSWIIGRIILIRICKRFF